MTPAEFIQARQSLGLTQAQLAEVLGYSRTHITRIEKGHLEVMPVAALAMRGLLAGIRPNNWPGA